MSWRQFAEEVRRREEVQDNRGIRDERSGANGPIVPNVLTSIDPARVRASWRDGLSKLDHTAPPAGISSMLWGRWLDDAEFIFNEHGWTAARYGFDQLDLFGVFPDKPGLGGIVDRLRGARDLQFTPDRATWSRYGVPSHFNRTGGQTLVRSGLVVLWSLAAAGAR
jgi:hypothetical protein